MEYLADAQMCVTALRKGAGGGSRIVYIKNAQKGQRLLLLTAPMH